MSQEKNNVKPLMPKGANPQASLVQQKVLSDKRTGKQPQPRKLPPLEGAETSI